MRDLPKLVFLFHSCGNCFVSKLNVHVLARLNPSATRNQHAKNAPKLSALGPTLISASALRRPVSPRVAPNARM